MARSLRIALFGASGSIGSAIAAEALSRGHTVVAVARDPGRVDVDALCARADEIAADQHATVRAGRDRLDVVGGDATDTARVAEVAGECDVVVSAVGGAADGRPEVVEDAARALLEGIGSTRLFVVGGAGSLSHPAGGTVSSQPGFPDAWKPSSNAQGRALELYRTAGDAAADWTYLSPAHVIEPGERTGTYRTGGDALVVDDAGESRITIADYAVAAVDELETPRFRGRRFTIGY
jgi:putative NADH-flavin reductase